MTKTIFEEKVINSNNISLLLFTASWSGNAEIMNSIVSKVSPIHQGMQFFNVDIEKSDNIADLFGISAVPTILIIKHGEVIEKIQRILSVNKLNRLISSILEKDAFS